MTEGVDPVDVTVAVVVKNRRAWMRECLAGVLEQTDVDLEIVVVDNGSTDGTADMCRELLRASGKPHSVVVDLRSVGALRNRAVQESHADIVAFTDSDCVPRPGWLQALLAPFADDRVGVVQGRTEPLVPTTGRRPVTQDIAGWTDLYEACNIAYRRRALGPEAFDEVIGFFGEDTAAGWTARRAGWKGTFAPDAVVGHQVSHPGFPWHLRRAAMYRRFPALVRRFPEMRRDLLWRSPFLQPRSAAVLLALGGLASAPRRPLAAALCLLPYAAIRVPRRPYPGWIEQLGADVVQDVVREAALVFGSVRERSLVL